uniref:Uncharacterized protein n=1 Tax=Panagrolaimus sp. ES5 TaxID=591445 RepID=A0AC34GXY2_9BILA
MNSFGTNIYIFLFVRISITVKGQTSENDIYENDDRKRAGGRGFDLAAINSNLLMSDKRAGGRGFLTNSFSNEINKRGGARGFSNNEEYHSAERRAGGRAFLMPESGADEIIISNKRAGGRPFYGMSDWKRAGGRLFHFYDAPMIKRAGGRGFVSSPDEEALMQKRAGGRSFAHYFGENAFFPKRAGSRPFYATNSWRGYPL